MGLKTQLLEMSRRVLKGKGFKIPTKNTKLEPLLENNQVLAKNFIKIERQEKS